MTDRTQPDSARAPLSADAPASSAHIKEPYTLAEIKAKMASHDYSAELLLQHAMLLLDGAHLSVNAGEPVAWWIPKAEQFCIADKSGDRPFAKAWEPLYAAPPTAQAEGWRPISTAPKDGALIVLGARNGVWLGKYVPVYQSGYRPENPWSSMLLNHDHMAERYTRPTHWMPLPPPPTSAEGAEYG